MISTIRKAYSYNSIRLVRHFYKNTQIGSQTSHLNFLLQEKLFNYPTLVNTLRLFSEIEMEVSDVMRRLEFRASKATEIIELLDRQISEVKKAAIAQSAMSEETRLKEENAVLKAEIEMWKQRLIKAELKNGVKQFHNYCLRSDTQNPSRGSKASQKTEQIFEKKGKFKEVKKTNGKNEIDNKSTKSGPSDERSVDVSRLDFRVGKIISAKKHPDANSLYVEQIDLGEGKNRTVVSGLVKFVPIEQMQNRIVVLLCNLKPAKMRGIVSEAMVMCASTPDKVEILSPPEDAVPGDRVICEEYPGDPDKELNPKKKIFEQVAPDLKTDEEKRATYKGKLLIIPGKGNIVAQSLLNVQIK